MAERTTAEEQIQKGPGSDPTKGAAISAIEHFKVYFLNVRRCIKSAAGIHQYLLYSPGIRYIIYIKGDIIWKKIVQNKRCVNF